MTTPTTEDRSAAKACVATRYFHGENHGCVCAYPDCDGRYHVCMCGSDWTTEDE